ncbi:hypothetical protein TRFO_08523 [Tritrichomonas foetus]|uniref:Uncharacterized protein n=1 Tax=Tritrichomonas foetus TaxID=1144522 RepID=A0A1J4JP22_9EUKA|nr:hypothetical protein TRFO_08523 [Tritrichomonas foetus]|eukprot:OHS99267.1 hypothetical protein TRFO_08523 [Tritrichomonas foetus]
MVIINKILSQIFKNKRIHKKTNLKSPTKPPPPLDGDAQLHAIIRDSINKLNSEVSVDDSAYPHLSGLNQMYRLFENTYTKNLTLIELCQSMNDDVITQVSQISGSLNESNDSQQLLKNLSSDYEKVLAVATEKRDTILGNRETITSLRNQINDIRKNLELKESDRIALQKKSMAATQQEITQIKVELVENQKKKEEMEIELREKTDSLNHLNKSIKSLKEEEEISTKLIAELVEKKSEMRKSNIETAETIKDIEENMPEQEEEEIREIDTDALENILKDLNLKILIYKEEKDDRAKMNYKASKNLKKIQQEIANRKKFTTGIKAEIKKRNSQLESLYQTIDDLEKERRELIPQYKAMAIRFADAREDKDELRARYKELQEKLFHMNYKYAKSDNEKQLAGRKVQHEKIDEQKLSSYAQRESNRAKEISKQAENAMHEIFLTKEKLFDMRVHVQSVSDEADDKSIQRKFFLSNYLVEKEIFQNNTKSCEELNEKLLDIRKKSEEQDKLCQVLREEKNKFKKQMEIVKKEHDQLSTQYFELITQIENMTKKIDVLVEQTISDHFLRAEYKSAMTYLNKMKKRTENGIKVTNKVIFDLQTEKQTLKKIIDQTTLDRLAQLKELSILKSSRDLILNQISSKEKEIEQKNNDILTEGQFLKKRKKDYDTIMDRVYELQNELESGRKRTVLLHAKVERVKDLIENKRRLEGHIMIKQCQSTALFQESQIKVSFHRWHEMSAFDPERLKQIKFFHRLKSEVIEKDEEYKKLAEERDKLKEDFKRIKINQMKTVMYNVADRKSLNIKDLDELNRQLNFAEETFFITKPTKTMREILQDEIAKTKRELNEKNIKINELERMIKERTENVNVCRKSISNVRQSVNQRKSITYKLKAENEEIERNNKMEKLQLFQVREPPEKGVFNKAMGGGFRPRPPKDPKTDIVPRIELNKIRMEVSDDDDEMSFAPRPPMNSQRSRRPDVKALRKRFSVAKPESARRTKKKKGFVKKKSNF